MSQNVSSAAVVIDALRVNAISLPICMLGNLQAFISFVQKIFLRNTIRIPNGLDPNQDQLS